MIAQYNATDPAYGYNTSAGGHAGHMQTQEAKDRIAQAKAGVPRPAWIIERMRQAPRTYVYTDDHRRRISEALKGHEISDDTRRKIGAKNINRNGRAVVQIDADGQQVAEYASINEACRQTGIFSQSIWQVCAGRRKTAGGFTWRYA